MQPETYKDAQSLNAWPRISVIIVTWNKRDYVLRLLDDLAASAYPNWTVRVVDSHSEDDTVKAVAERHPWVKILPLPENLGGTGGFNAGMRAVLQEDDCDYVWLLDNDVSLEPGALEVLVETLESRPDAGVAGSHIIQMDNEDVTNEIGGDVDLVHGRLLLREHGTQADSHRREIYEVDYVAACSLLVRFEVLRQVGIWDDFFIHYDDVDWCLRIRAAGHRVLACAASRVRHMSARAKPVTWVLYYDIRNMLYLQRKHMAFDPIRELRFLAVLMYFSVRDALSGKDYYARLIEQAVRDFADGRMGKAAAIPALDFKPAKETLPRLLDGPAGSILVLEPARKIVFDEMELTEASRKGILVQGVRHEHDRRCTALPAGAPRFLLSCKRWIMVAQIIKYSMLKKPADWLVLDIDIPCGFLGLCARRIMLVADDQCHETRGGLIRLLAAAVRLLRWIPILFRWAVFSPPFKRLRSIGGKILRFQRHAPALLFPSFSLYNRLRRWPLPQRIKNAQARLAGERSATPPSVELQPAGTGHRVFNAGTAEELKTALREAAVAGGDIRVTASRIELDETLNLASGIRLIGASADACLVFRNIAVGLSVCGTPDSPLKNCVISNLAIYHESSSGGFSAAIRIARARNIMLNRVRIDSPCAIGILVADGAKDIALDHCTVCKAGQDGVLMARQVLDFSANACVFSHNTQSGVLICDWRLPAGLDALDFDAQLRDPDCLAVAFAAEDPGPWRIRFLDCEIEGNRKMGLCTDGAGYLSVEGCRMLHNQCEGITLDNGTWHALVSGCLIHGNGRRDRQSEEELRIDFVAGEHRLADGSSAVKLPGISMDNAAFCRIEECDIRGNYGEGIKFVRAAYRCTIKSNTIEDNNLGCSPGYHHHGIRIGADPAQHPGQHDFPSCCNEIIGNLIRGKHECGILLNQGTTLNRIDKNRIEGTNAGSIRNWNRFANRIRYEKS